MRDEVNVRWFNRGWYIKNRPVVRNFYGGRGGGAYLKNRDQIINVWIIRHGTSEVTRWQSVQATDH